MLSEQELTRYYRQIIIPEIGKEGHAKLKKARVLVVGAGGLGGPILYYLTFAGIGTIGIVDSDVVELSNLNRQILFNTDDIGELKAETARKHLIAKNPSVNIKTYNTRLSKENALKIIKDYDIVADGTDNFSTRYIIDTICSSLKIPYIFGSINAFEGQVSVFNYKDGPRYSDLFPVPLDETDRYNIEPVGVIGVIPGIIGCIQTNEIIKIILGTGDVLSGRLLVFNGLNVNFNIHLIKK